MDENFGAREVGKMSDKKKLTGIIGFRVFPSYKKELAEEAAERGKTLSQYIYELIEIGREEFVKRKSVKQSP